MTRPLAAVLAAATLALLASGCTENRNQRITIGSDVPLASFPPEVIEPELDQDGNPVPPTPPADDAATARGLDRSNFEPLVYRVPIDGTRHELHGIDRLAWPSETARQRGEFPTVITALETGSGPSTRSQALEILAQPVIAAGGLLFHSAGLIYPEWLAGHFISGTVESQRPLWERAPVPADPERQGLRHLPLATPDSEAMPNDAASG